MGKLGNGINRDSFSHPSQVEGKYLTVDWGEHHTLAIDNEYSAYSWGWNSDGQLGSKRANGSEDWLIPKQVFHLKGKTIVGVSAGSYHSSFVTIDGFVYWWGNNENGQLGIRKENVRVPMLHPNLLGHGISFINSKYEKSYFISAWSEKEPDIDYFKRFY